jgi:hypothetical protein
LTPPSSARVRLLAPPLGALLALVWACGNDRNPNLTADVGDGGPSVDVGGGGDGGASDDLGGPGPDASTNPCFFVDEASPSAELDPVALCVQEQALTYEIQQAYIPGAGVAPGWSSTGSHAALPGHDWQDDLGLAGALGAFYCSAEVYGNSHSTASFSTVLNDLDGVLLGELQATPSPTQGMVDGEIYFRLRWAQAAFEYVNNVDADAMKRLADAYGATLASQAYEVGGGPGDGGSPGGVVIGAKNADGSVAYSPSQAVMAAAALLDMANLGAAGPDASSAGTWASTAQQIIAYVLARGHDPVTGLFYQSLVTSGDPDHDAIGPGTPTGDSMLTETQAWITLGLARAQDLLATLQAGGGLEAGAADGSVPAQSVYWLAGNDLVASVTGAGLFDGTTNPSTPPPVGALMEGLVLSDHQILGNKTTLGNAIMLGGFHRVAVGEGSVLAYELGEIRAALVRLQPASSSLLSIVTDPDGDVIQQSYLRAGSKEFGYAVAYSTGGDGAGAGLETGADHYRSDAVHAMVEGFTQLWHGSSNAPRCAP